MAGAVLLISELGFFLTFVIANLAIIYCAVFAVHVEQPTIDALRDASIGSGAVLATIILGQQIVSTVLGRFLK
jgi:hypothetical protein